MYIQITRLLILLMLVCLNVCKFNDNQQSTDNSQKIKNLYEHYDDNFKEFLHDITESTGKEIMRYEDINSDLLAKKIIINGSYYDLGYHLGLLGQKIGRFPRNIDQSDKYLNEEIVKIYEKIYPQCLDKIEGLADALEMDKSEIDLRHVEEDYYAEITWYLFNYSEFEALTGFNQVTFGCSLAAYSLENGKNFVGRNFDYGYDVPRFVVICNLEGVYKTICNTGWVINQFLMDGINEKGLFIGLAANTHPEKYAGFGNKPYPQEVSVGCFHIMRIVLDVCSTVDEALKLINEMNIWFSKDFQHFLLVDQG